MTPSYLFLLLSVVTLICVLWLSQLSFVMSMLLLLLSVGHLTLILLWPSLLFMLTTSVNEYHLIWNTVKPVLVARLPGKYRWREFPAVITGNYRPGKYSKFWQSGKYWEIWNFNAVWTKIFCNISKNLSWQQIFLIAYVLIMQINYKIPWLVHPRGHSRWFLADSQVLSYHLSSLVSTLYV